MLAVLTCVVRYFFFLCVYSLSSSALLSFVQSILRVCRCSDPIPVASLRKPALPSEAIETYVRNPL
jgi:hypothetical protein